MFAAGNGAADGDGAPAGRGSAPALGELVAEASSQAAFESLSSVLEARAHAAFDPRFDLHNKQSSHAYAQLQECDWSTISLLACVCVVVQRGGPASSVCVQNSPLRLRCASTRQR